MRLLSTLNKLINGEKPQQGDEPTATRPVQVHRDRDATRPTFRINDEKWHKIQQAIDQAG